MAYRKRRVYRRKRMVRRKFRRGARYNKRKVSQGKVYKYKRTFESSAIPFSSAAQNYAYSFKLTDLPNYGDFVSLYDQYMMTGVKIKLVPLNTQSSIIPVWNGTIVAQSSNISIPQCVSVIDYDDANVLTAKTQYFEYQNHKIFNCVNYHQRYFKPHVALGAYSGAFTSYANKYNQWLDCDSNTVQHYGFKLFVDAANSQLSGNIWRVYFTYYLKFKNTR